MEDASQWDPRSLWDMLRSSGRNIRTLCRKLEQFSMLDLCRYGVAYDNLKSEVNPHSWEECHPYLSDSCSEDHSDDFAAWVVMQGAEFYDGVAAHPERIQQYLEMFSESESGRGYTELRWDEEVDRDEYRGYQRPDYIAAAIYHSKYGGNFHEACYDARGWPREGLE